MGKKTSIALIILGILLVVVAVVWWAAGLGTMLTKLPSDINTQMDFEGNLTLYVNPETQQPFPAGQEMALPLTVARTFAAVPDLFTSSVGVFEDTLLMNVAGEEGAPQLARYALDRTTRKCVDSAENWYLIPEIAFGDRGGNLGPLFPGDLNVGDKVSAFFNDPGMAFDVTVAEKIDDWNGLGVTALKLDATRASTEYNPAVAQAFLAVGQGLPMEISFAQLSAQLKAQGLDLEALISALASVAAPEDMQALQAMTLEPIKLVYKQESGDVIYIEQKTGATIGATFDRTTTMSIDTTALLGAFGIMGKYATDPTVGPMIAAAMQAGTQLATAPPNKVFNQNMSIIPASNETLVASAKDKIPLLSLAKLWIPVIVVVVGALLLLLGASLLVRARKRSAGAAPTKA